MRFQLWPAMLAGLGGALAMAGLRVLMRAAGVDLRMDVLRMWGSMLKAHGRMGHLVGWVVHLMVSGSIGIIYAWVFDAFRVTNRLWLWGLLAAVIHWINAGLFLTIAPAMHPEIPERNPVPGPFARNYGTADVLGFLVGHLGYGLSFGMLYDYLHGRTAKLPVGRSVANLSFDQ
jgi:hypothetical protein